MRQLSFRQYFMVFLVFTAILAGCQKLPDFPLRPFHVKATDSGCTELSYDLDRDGEIDYRQVTNRHGRKVILQLDNQKSDQPGQANQTVMLDELANSDVIHIILALDGVPYELVEELYNEGHFRLFHKPSKLVSCFPSMTDLAFSSIFGGAKPMSYQAEYFDPDKNRLVCGNDVYLSGMNADWSRQLDYRCSFWFDTLVYINPELVFNHELRGMMKVLEKTEGGTVKFYSVGTAGLGTCGGREAILNYLREIDLLCEQIVYERQGKVKITLLADHGHNMAGNSDRGRITFSDIMEKNNYRITNKLDKPGDVVAIEYGLVTIAAFFTKDPGGVANVLLHDAAVTLACYPQGRDVVVQTLDGYARIIEHKGQLTYQCESGDPLQLLDIIRELQTEQSPEKQTETQSPQAQLLGVVSQDSLSTTTSQQPSLTDRAFLLATANHIYPDPVKRIWGAFHGLVEKPADLIVCLQDGWYHGDPFFSAATGGAVSTHGSLNRINSNTFVMSMWGRLPEVLRLEELLPAIELLQFSAGKRASLEPSTPR